MVQVFILFIKKNMHEDLDLGLRRGNESLINEVNDCKNYEIIQGEELENLS